MWKNDYSRRLVLANRQAKVSKDFTFSYVHVKKKREREQKLPRQFLPCKQGSLTGWHIGGAIN